MPVRVLIAAISVVAAVLAATSASAAADVRLTALDCESHPRRIRVENMGTEAASLSGWQLLSDPGEGDAFDLGQIGSLNAGQKVFVFQGHLAPPGDPSAGFYRWGVDDTFFLRAGDSTDYVRIVDSQGNTVDQRNCEGVAVTPTPYVTPEPAVQQPSAGSTSDSAPAPSNPRPRSSVPSSASNNSAGPALPGGGGPPGTTGEDPALPLFLGAISLAAGVLLIGFGARRRREG